MKLEPINTDIGLILAHIGTQLGMGSSVFRLIPQYCLALVGGVVGAAIARVSVRVMPWG